MNTAFPTSAVAQGPGPLETLSRNDVMEALDNGLKGSKRIINLMQAMVQAGCPVGRDFFHVARCNDLVGGGFVPDHGVILCHNRLYTTREVLNAVTHELIHAYDHCRWRGAGAERMSQTWAPVASMGAGGSATPVPVESDCAGAAAATAGGAAAVGSPGGRAAPSTAEAPASRGSCEPDSTDGGARDAPSRGPAGGGQDVDSSGSNVYSTRGNPNRRTQPGSGSDDASEGGGVGGGLDWTNCRHHACTEIRAANLSGDCSLWQELARGNLPLWPDRWAAQQRACVARRAALSVAMNPACEGPDVAATVVAEMMPRCLEDTAPFEASEGVARP